MNVLNSIYTQLEARLKGIKTLKNVQWYNQQYQNMDDERATRYPVVYVEFENPITWLQSGDKFQYADVLLKLHAVVYDIKDPPTEALQFGQAVYEQLNGAVLYDQDRFQISGVLVRERSSFPKRYDQLKVVELDFRCRIFDRTGMPDLTGVVPDFKINV